ncbi:hypothetical protein GGF46_001357 [Coemansia sp. RSA 552]|nr:hypothetical protein GGF46_001357 [Coemansia sp. RSA 552]
MLFSRGKLQVIPDSPDVIVYGSPREARCALISGRVVYTTRAPRPISALVVRFRPMEEAVFSSAMSIACQPDILCTIVKDGCVAASALELPYDEATGQYEWRFTMAIPGDTCESVSVPSAFITYELAAEIRMPSAVAWMPLARQTSATPIAVKRVPAPDSLWESVGEEPLDVSAVWRERLELSATAPSRIMHDSSVFHVNGIVRPLVKGIRILHATFELRESACGPFDQRKHTVARRAHNLCASAAGTSPGSLSPPLLGVSVDQEIQIPGNLDVPKAYVSVQYDIPIGPIRVSHELVFSVSAVDECGQMHLVRLSTGVYVFPCRSPPLLLPSYGLSGKDTLLATGRRWSHSTPSAGTGGDGLAGPGSNDDLPPPAYSPAPCGGIAANIAEGT